MNPASLPIPSSRECTPPSSRFHRWLRTLAVWLVSAGLIAYVLREHDLQQLAESLQSAPWLDYLILVLGFAVTTLLLEGWFLGRAFRWFSHPIPFGSMVQARGASYVLAVLSSFVGMGGLVVFMKKKHGVTYRTGGSVMLLEVYFEVFSMGLLCLLASWVSSDAPVEAHSQIAGAGTFGLGAVAFCLVVWIVSRVQGYRRTSPPSDGPAQSLSDLSLGQCTSLFGIKLAQNAVHGVFVVLALATFGIAAPWLLAFAFSQIIRTVRGLPISAFGLGVDQLGFVTLLGPWDPGSGSQILALSLAYTVSMLASRGLLGLACLPSALNRPDASTLPESTETPPS